MTLSCRGWSHHLGRGKPLKTTKLHFPVLNTSTQSLHSNTTQEISNEIFSHTEVAWLLLVFLFLIKKKLASSFQEKIGHLDFLPMEGGKSFVVIFLPSPLQS